MIKEFREFFLRNSQVNTGLKADQEIGFPYQYFVKGKLVYNRFLKDHYPSGNVFGKLLESIGFKLNVEDTANYNGLDIQGFVKSATDSNVQSRTSRSTPTDFMTVVQPHQIPTIITQAQLDAFPSGTVTAIGTNITGSGLTVSRYKKETVLHSGIFQEVWVITHNIVQDTNSGLTLASLAQPVDIITMTDGGDYNASINMLIELGSGAIVNIDITISSFSSPIANRVIHNTGSSQLLNYSFNNLISPIAAGDVIRVMVSVTGGTATIIDCDLTLS